MTKLTVQEAKEFTLFPEETILHLKIDEVNITEQDGRNGPWQKAEFKFTVLGIVAVGDGSNPADYVDAIGTNIWGRGFSANLTSHPENRMRLWAEAIFNADLDIGFEVDTDLFLNREVRGVTVQYDKKNVDPATGRPFRGHQVDALLRPGQRGQQSAPQQAPQQQQLPYGQPQQGWGQQPPPQTYTQPQYAQPPAAQQDPWATPAQQAPQQPPPPAQQDPWGPPPPQDPWGGHDPGGDEPPF